MIFREAYYEMLKGKKIKRPCFDEYWYIDKYGNVVIHDKDDNENSNGDLAITLRNVMAEDWQVVKL